jgi:thermitase
MAAALAASVAAMWISYHGYENLVEHYGNAPSALQEAFRKIIWVAGHRRPNDWDTGRYGAGIIDAAKVLAAPLPELE